MLYYCNLMKKYFLFIIIMLFITNCANLDFVYESNKQIFIELKNNTSLIIIGDEADEVNAYIVSFLESTNNKNPNYQLSINSKITEEAQVIGKDAIASKFSIEYHIGYSLYNINKKCKIIEAEIVTKDSFVELTTKDFLLIIGSTKRSFSSRRKDTPTSGSSPTPRVTASLSSP